MNDLLHHGRTKTSYNNMESNLDGYWGPHYTSPKFYEFSERYSILPAGQAWKTQKDSMQKHHIKHYFSIK